MGQSLKMKLELTPEQAHMKVRREVLEWVRFHFEGWKHLGVEVKQFTRMYDVFAFREGGRPREDWGLAVGPWGSLEDFDPVREREGVTKVLISREMTPEHAKILIQAAVDGVRG
jgi:hypothetical protein